MSTGPADLLPLRLAAVASLELAVILLLAFAFRLRRRDGVALLLVCAASGAALAAAQPLVALGEYCDYKYYLHSIGAIGAGMPRRWLYTWLLAGTSPYQSLFWLNGLLAGSLPALSYLAAITAGASRSMAAAAAIALIGTAPFLVFAADANPVTPFAWSLVSAALLVEAFLREPGRARGWIALALSSVVAVFAFVCREEAIFLAVVLPASLLGADRIGHRRRALALAVWTAFFAAAHLALARHDPQLYSYLVGRVDQYSQRLGHQLFLFPATNALLLAVPLVLWNQRHRPLIPALSSPLLLPALAYTLIYLNGAAAQEHQIAVLPLLVPQTAIALQALWRARPRLAIPLAAVIAAWVLGTTAFTLTTCRLGAKQREYDQLSRGVASGSSIYFLRYPAYDADPEAPLMALLDDSVRLAELLPPSGCPPTLYTALAWMHERCVENYSLLPRCRQAVARAGDDWSEQALWLARLLALKPRDLPTDRLSRQSKWSGPWPPVFRGTQPAMSRNASDPAASREYLFVPFWVHRDLFSDLPAADFEEFRWLEAARMALDLPLADIRKATRSLVPVRVRGAAEAAAQCEALRLRPSGAALFAILERPAKLQSPISP